MCRWSWNCMGSSTRDVLSLYHHTRLLHFGDLPTSCHRPSAQIWLSVKLLIDSSAPVVMSKTERSLICSSIGMDTGQWALAESEARLSTRRSLLYHWHKRGIHRYSASLNHENPANQPRSRTHCKVTRAARWILWYLVNMVRVRDHLFRLPELISPQMRFPDQV